MLGRSPWGGGLLERVLVCVRLGLHVQGVHVCLRRVCLRSVCLRCVVCVYVSAVCSPVSGHGCQTPPHSWVLTLGTLPSRVPDSGMCVWRGLNARLWAT